MTGHAQTDSGIAWLVPISACLINAILFGVYRSYGIVLTAIIKEYSVSRSEATWFISLCMTVIHLTGPVSGLLNNYFNAKAITFFGCALASIGVGLCYFASSVLHIVICVGIIQGFGIGLTFVQIPAIVNQYFVKFRASANGLAMSGGTIGAFVFCPLTSYCLRHFKLDELFLILASITLFSIPISLFFKPMKTEKNAEKEKIAKALKTSPVYLISFEREGLKLTENFRSHQKSEIIVKTHNTAMMPIRVTADGITKTTSEIALYMERKLSCTNAMEVIKKISNSAARSQMRQNFDKVIEIIENPYFVLICLTHLAYFWGSLTYIMVIVDHAEDRGIANDVAAQLITTYSGGDLVGRLGSGWFVDRNVIPIKYLGMISVAFIGLVLKAVPFMSNFNILTIASLALGFLSGTFVVLLNILFCKYLGTNDTPLALGLSSFFCGLTTLVRPIVVGYYRDAINGSYDGLFNSLSVAALFTAVLWFFEPIIKRKAKLDKCNNDKAKQGTVVNKV
ncbi:monocarboxylate transporter-like protein [Dinothrombium tinctorium]|uniref:Monocarboxylate transporter-like protein n=1 Tax=Dinothrombium tinctorium TaxID=1965070 RepID=A0A3S3PNV0_9ACAR|nr:monocarboxylate transporter-like protein [Dinothrombium tinctorium]